MEEKLLKIFQLADSLNEKQNKIYIQITYTADDNKTLELFVRNKKDFSYIEKCEIKLYQNPLIKWDNIIELLEKYIGGAADE